MARTARNSETCGHSRHRCDSEGEEGDVSDHDARAAVFKDIKASNAFVRARARMFREYICKRSKGAINFPRQFYISAANEVCHRVNSRRRENAHRRKFDSNEWRNEERRKREELAIGGDSGGGRWKTRENLEAGDSEKVRATIRIVIRGNAGT